MAKVADEKATARGAGPVGVAPSATGEASGDSKVAAGDATSNAENGSRVRAVAPAPLHLEPVTPRRRLVRDSDTMAPRTNDSRVSALDDVSKRIIEELQQDGRRSYAALAKSVGLSEAAVRQRVQRLLDSGVMQIVAVTDPATVGFSRQAMVGIRADGDIREIAERLSALPELEYVVVCAGSFDLLTELVCENDEHLLQILNESVRTIPGVRETETFVYLRLIKQTYAWGTR